MVTEAQQKLEVAQLERLRIRQCVDLALQLAHLPPDSRARQHPGGLGQVGNLDTLVHWLP